MYLNGHAKTLGKYVENYSDINNVIADKIKAKNLYKNALR